jgi:hypothetical protein
LGNLGFSKNKKRACEQPMFFFFLFLNFFFFFFFFHITPLEKKHVLSNLGKGSFPRGSKVLQGWKVIGKVGTFPSTPRLERTR